MKKKILAVGNAYLDQNFTGVPFPDTGFPAERELAAKNREIVPGGSALNFTRLCVHLGLAAEFVGKIGDDSFGQELVRLTREAGIEPAFIVDPGARTNTGINLVNESSKVCMLVEGTANPSLTPAEILTRVEPLLPDLGFVYFGGCFKLPNLLPGFARLAIAAKAQGVKVAIDHGRMPSDITSEIIATIRELALAADYYLPSKDEFCELWKVHSIEAGLQKLHTQTAATITVKDAGRGGATMVDGKLVRVPAFPVEVSNSIGAGDSFNAGFIAATANGRNLNESMQLGCAAAALKISRPNLPTFAEAEAMVHARQTGKTTPLAT